MRNFRIVLIIIVFVSASINCFSQQVEIAVGEYAPFIDSAEANDGFMTELVMEAFKSVRIVPTFNIKPWARVEQEVLSGESVSYAYVKDSEREKVFIFSDEILGSTTVIVSRKDKNIPRINSVQDMKRYKIGTSRGYAYGEEFENYRDQLNIEIANDDLLNIKKILGGRIDIFLCDPFVAALLIKNNFNTTEQAQFKLVTDNFFPNDPMYLIVGKKHPSAAQIIRKFNEGLRKITASGKREQILP